MKKRRLSGFFLLCAFMTAVALLLGDGWAEGYTGEYVRVRAKAAANTFACVRILRAEGTLAIGEMLSEDRR